MSHLRFNDKGDEVEIQAQLPEVHAIMQRRSFDVVGSNNSRWTHLRYFDLPVYPMDDRYHMGKVGHISIELDNQLNLSFLRAVTLDEGIEISLQGGGYNEHSWGRIRDCAAKAIQDLVRRHYMPAVHHTVKKDNQVVEENKEPITEVSMSTRSVDETTDRLFIGTKPEPEEKDGGERYILEWLETDTTDGNITYETAYTL